MDQNLNTTNICSVQKPVETANGLPNGHYTNPQVFTKKSEAVLKVT